MKQLLSIALLFVASLAQAQEEKGMKFEHANSWAEIKAKAKAENKYIFLDAYTTWCGPCIMMAKEIFPLKEVGDFYNANFINVKVQLDETAKDSEEVKKWRSDAKYLADTYSIRAYPTYLFFSPDGEVVHRAVGSSPGEVFISKGKDALDPDKQYYTLKKQYLEGKKDTTFLLKVTNASIEAYDADFSKKVAAEYLATQTDLLSPQNLKLLARTTEKTSDRGFAILKNNVAKADEAIGKGRTKSILHNIAVREFVIPTLSAASLPNKSEPDWKQLKDEISKSLPDMAEELVLAAKPMYYMRAKDWPKFSASVTEYFSKFSDSIDPNMLNNYAWEIFKKCDDMACIQQALAWSKKTLEGKNAKQVMYLDTYANLLHKSGKTAEAIKIQEEAVALSGEKDDSGSLTKVLNKMKKGEKTW